MLAEQVMTREVITVSPDMLTQDAARLLVKHRISGLPVVDEDGHVMGILTEADLIVRQKAPEPGRSWWYRFLIGPEELAEQYRRTAGATVRDVMTRAVICIDPEMPIEAVASLFHHRGIKRVPVVKHGCLVGIVSRADLVRAYAAGDRGQDSSRADAEIVRGINERLHNEPWAHRSAVVVRSQAGVVELWGLVESESERAAVGALARNVAGVKDVKSSLAVRSEVMPYVYWRSEGPGHEGITPAELQPGTDPWDPQHPAANP